MFVCLQVKGMLLHLCLKWDLAIKANNIKQVCCIQRDILNKGIQICDDWKICILYRQLLFCVLLKQIQILKDTKPADVCSFCKPSFCTGRRETFPKIHVHFASSHLLTNGGVIYLNVTMVLNRYTCSGVFSCT